ncbi:STAS domain-containing protein [Streptomyces nojiriensis]|uniref:STAS domain-containing protein n=1 Tax=Streptomyces nojiriensis TaxID=66374 RepID=UPI0036D972CC
MADDQDSRARLSVEHTGQGVIVHVRGEMDIDHADRLRETLHAEVTHPQGSAEIVVDVTDLTFCDSAGLNALLQARLTAQDLGRHIQLHNPSRQMSRLLELTGADQFFPTTPA